MMKKKTTNNRGFTLLEIIMSIVIITILGVMAGRGFLEIAKGYVLSRKNATVAQHGQITAARLKKELSASTSIECGGSNMITYKIKRDASEDTTTIYWAGGNNPLMLKTASDCTVCTSACTGGDKLAENLAENIAENIYGFKVSYCTSTTNCSDTFPNNPDFTKATVSLVKVTLKLKGYDDTMVSIADPDLVILNQESGS